MVTIVNSKRQTLVSRADQLGIAASTFCFLHCVVTPIVFSLSIVSAHFLPSEERTHRVLAVVVSAIGGIAAVSGYTKHRRVRVITLIAAGLFCIFFGAYWGDHLPSHQAEVAVTLLGSCLMIAGHKINHTFCKDCHTCQK